MRKTVGVGNGLLVIHYFLIAIVLRTRLELLAFEEVLAAEGEGLHQRTAALVRQLMLAPRRAAIEVEQGHLDQLSLTPLRLRVHRNGRRRRVEHVHIAVAMVFRTASRALKIRSWIVLLRHFFVIAVVIFRLIMNLLLVRPVRELFGIEWQLKPVVVRLLKVDEVVVVLHTS